MRRLVAQDAVSGAVDSRMVAAMRCLLALVALVTTYFDTQHAGWPGLLFASLLAYLGYSIALFAIRGEPLKSSGLQPWIDAIFYAFLVALTHGTISIFSHFFLFAIIVAAFWRGFREAMALTIFSVMSFSSMGLAGYALGMKFDLSQALTGASSLFVLGYLIARWGEKELALHRRLMFLRELLRSVDPRAGLDGVIYGVLHRLLEFFRARACVLIRPKPGSELFLLYRVDRDERVPGAPDEVGEEIGRRLMGLPADARLSYDARLPRLAPRVSAWGADRSSLAQPPADAGSELANLLETPSFASAPFKQSEGVVGRLYVTSDDHRFSEADTEFLAQAVAQAATAINNVALLNDLTTTATQQERSRISRDIHDTTVQSYIGLKLALEALYRDIPAGSPGTTRIKELLDMATLTVDDLRLYVDRLSGRRSRTGAEKELLAQLEEQKRRYRDYHGVDVQLRPDDALQVNAEVAGEAYRIVCEALSNVFRHTSSRRAIVELRCLDGMLEIDVSNDVPAGAPTPAFTPRSIAERARSLGGRFEVRLGQAGRDTVRVALPLRAAESPPAEPVAV